jgi:hypothetical protein
MRLLFGAVFTIDAYSIRQSNVVTNCFRLNTEWKR